MRILRHVSFDGEANYIQVASARKRLDSERLTRIMLVTMKNVEQLEAELHTQVGKTVSLGALLFGRVFAAMTGVLDYYGVEDEHPYFIVTFLPNPDSPHSIGIRFTAQDVLTLDESNGTAVVVLNTINLA